MTLTTSKVLLLIAVILFVLVGFKVEPEALSSIDLIGFGLAFFAASFLVP
jgi:hypothetical protein